ncbi:MAG: DEAD/DEAH box helicase family protein [Actinomycetota bacterium]|nr:DEAD/DEAH box helicase family protein [Actinomycetota bacterium]
MSALNALLTQLDPERKGAQFEHVSKWFLENDLKYRDEFKKVWLWKDWPGRDGRRDKGIDIVAQEHGGQLWAVQTKCYAADQSIRLASGHGSDLNSFIADSARAAFSRRLVITTTNRMSSNAKETLDQLGVLRITLDDLLASPVDWPDSLHDLRRAKPKRKTPRPHQREAMRAVIEGFLEHDRGQMILPCGTGKTLISLFIAEELNSHATLVVVPSLLVLKQTIREWMDNATVPFHPIAVCSDQTSMTHEDEWVMSAAEIGIRRITTDPDELLDFLGEQDPIQRKVVFSTYQSLDVVTKAQEKRSVTFDLAIADEAHRTAGSNGKGLYGLFVDARALVARRRLFMTATPRITKDNVKSSAASQGISILSMDDPVLYGPIFHRMSFRKAIELKLLSDYRILVYVMTTAECRKMVSKRRYVSIDGKVKDSRDLANEIGLVKAMKSYDLRKVVTFHRTIKKSLAFKTALSDAHSLVGSHHRTKRLGADHISGAMNHKHRDTVLEQFAESDGPAVLTNSRCLGEGVNVPSIDAVVFVDPKGSAIDIGQATGRAIRLDPKNPEKLGYIIIPVFLGENDDVDRAISNGAFDAVWQVVNAMRDQDEALVDEIDSIRQSKGGLRRITSTSSTGKLIAILPKSLGSKKVRQFVDAITAKVVERGNRPWTSHEDEWLKTASGSLEEQGNHLGRTRLAVGMRRFQLGIARAKTYRVDEGEIARLYTAGKTSPEIAQALGVSGSAIRRNVKKLLAAGSIERQSPVSRPTKICATCGKQFRRPPSRLGKYCSLACRPPKPKASDDVLMLEGVAYRRTESLAGQFDMDPSILSFWVKKNHVRSHRVPEGRNHQLWICVDDVMSVREEQSRSARGRINALDPGDEKWEAKRLQAISFRKQNGYWPGTKDGPVGRWVCAQRNRKRRGYMSKPRIDALNDTSEWIWEGTQGKRA